MLLRRLEVFLSLEKSAFEWDAFLGFYLSQELPLIIMEFLTKDLAKVSFI